MIVLLPVSVYRVDFQIGTGRPYSAFERLLLEAVRADICTLDSLADTFRLHRRLIIEAVITLMHAGWLEIDGQSGSFRATESAKRTLMDDTVLPPGTVLLDRHINIVMERVAGQVCPGSDVTFYDKKRIAKSGDTLVKAPKSDLPTALSAASVLPFLGQKDGWLRHIGPITLKRDNVDYVLVDVDINNAELRGIPRYWETQLRDVLLDLVERKKEQAVIREQAITDQNLRRLLKYSDYESPIQSWSLNVAEDDIKTGESQLDLLREVIEQAKEYVCITSSEVSGSGYEAVTDEIRRALLRGVVVDILWNCAQPLDGQETFRLLEINPAQGESRWAGNLLRANRRPLSFNVNLIIGDSPNGWVGYFSSRPWLLPVAPKGSPPGLTIRFRHPGLLADLCTIVGDLLLTDPDMRLTNSASRLRNQAADFARECSLNYREFASGNAEVRVMCDNQILGALGQIVAQADSRLFVSSPTPESAFVPPTATLIARVQRNKSILVDIAHTVTKDDLLMKVLDEMRQAGADVRGDLKIDANIASADGRVALVTSCALLSHWSGITVHRREIGFVVAGKAAVEKLDAMARRT